LPLWFSLTFISFEFDDYSIDGLIIVNEANEYHEQIICLLRDIQGNELLCIEVEGTDDFTITQPSIGIIWE
jgi:hypothetical protein